MKKKFTQEYSEYGKTPCEWLKSWTELKYRPDSDNIDEYIQKFKELATLLAYPEDHQVQIFKMMMPENIELRIKDMTTLNQCIDEAKACLTICQPSSLVSKMNTLTLAKSDEISTPCSRSPSPAHRSQINTANNRQADPDKNHLFLRDQLFKDSDNIQVMLDHLPCLTQEILFLIQGSDLSPDLDPDLDLEQI